MRIGTICEKGYKRQTSTIKMSVLLLIKPLGKCGFRSVIKRACKDITQNYTSAYHHNKTWRTTTFCTEEASSITESYQMIPLQEARQAPVKVTLILFRPLLTKSEVFSL